jgi:hypothetical protein
VYPLLTMVVSRLEGGGWMVGVQEKRRSRGEMGRRDGRVSRVKWFLGGRVLRTEQNRLNLPGCS